MRSSVLETLTKIRDALRIVFRQTGSRRNSSRISRSSAASFARRAALPADLIVLPPPSAPLCLPPAFARTTYRWKVLRAEVAADGGTRSVSVFVSFFVTKHVGSNAVAAKCPPRARMTTHGRSRSTPPRASRNAASAATGSRSRDDEDEDARHRQTPNLEPSSASTTICAFSVSRDPFRDPLEDTLPTTALVVSFSFLSESSSESESSEEPEMELRSLPSFVRSFASNSASVTGARPSRSRRLLCRWRSLP